MSEELKRKLNNYEENPPEKNWAKIATALDEEIYAEFPRRLYRVEIDPPTDTWGKITDRLDAGVKQEYSSKLYDLEVSPPIGSWEKIVSSLDNSNPIREISRRRRIAPFVKYAAAACLVGIMVLGALKIFNQRTDHAVTRVVVAPKNDSQISAHETVINPSSQIAASNNLPKEGPALVRRNSISKRKDIPEQTAYMTQTINASGGDLISSPANGFRQAALRGEVPGNCALISDTDPYMMFMNPNGYLIRISKKLADALGCAYSGGNAGDNDPCEDQIKRWRDRIAQSPASSSPDNFMNILDIIRSVEE